MGYRLYVIDGSIKPRLRDSITKAIKRSVPTGANFTGVVATGFTNLTQELGKLSKPEHIAKHGHITDLIIVAHGDLAGSFNMGRDKMVAHQEFDKLAQPFDAFASRARVHVLRCTSSGLGQSLSTSEDRSSLYQKIGTKLLPRGGRVGGTINDVEFSAGGGVRLTRFQGGNDVPVGGKYPSTFHSLELLLTKPQESVGIDWTYTVRHNDNLTKIARKHGVPVQALYGANRKRVGPNPNLIHEGLKLVIPAGAGGASVISGQATGRAKVSAAPLSRYPRARTATRSTGIKTLLSRSTLKQGMRGQEVGELQRHLGITADSIYGPRTVSAVKAFQRGHGLQVDGIVGSQTRAKLFGTSVGSVGAGITGLGTRSLLKRGMRGPDVRTLQQHLGITSDGIYGPRTVSTVKRFQRSHGLQVDGIVGSQTRARMFGGSAGTADLGMRSVLKRGMRGQDVMAVQERLGIRADGIYGPRTVSAVTRYQRSYGLKADGMFGSQTRNHMLDPVRQADWQLRTMRSPRTIGRIHNSTQDLLRHMEKKAESQQQTERWLRGLQNKFK